MSPEKIASHEPTAVRRDPGQGTSGEPVSSGSTSNIKTAIWNELPVNQMNQHRVYQRHSVVKNVGKHLVHVRN